MLRYRLLEQFHRRDDVETVDFFGPASDATGKWATDSYAVGQITVALDGPLAHTALAAYRHIGPLVRKIRGSDKPLEITAGPPPLDEHVADPVASHSAAD